MKISQIAKAYGIEVQKAAGNKKLVDKPQKGLLSDSVQVSKEAENLSNTSASAKATLHRVESLPDIRWDKVNEVKDKLASGYYGTSAFNNLLADRLLKDFGFENS